MPPKRTGKKGQVVKSKSASGTVKSSATAKAGTAAAAKRASTEKEAPSSRAKTATPEQPAPEAGKKRAEPEPPSIDLQATLERKQKLSDELQTVEKQIYDLETRYLENSHPLGNAIRGYEGLLTQSQASTRRTLVKKEDRLFSNSSATGVPH